MCAPLQGFTGAAYRHLHSTMAGGLEAGVEYFTPFMRVERGEVRRRDIADITSPLNDGVRLTPQIIFRDLREFDLLIAAVLAGGHRRVDLNMGCPFPPQVRKGRGSGLLGAPDILRVVRGRMEELTGELEFSVKMRVGIEREDEWRGVADEIALMPLRHVAVHPRTASQQYAGELHTGEFRAVCATLPHPVIWNGEITSPAGIDRVREEFPQAAGVMIGRGLLSHPSLAAEWHSGTEWSDEERRDLAIGLHRRLLDHYEASLCGGAQVMAHIQPWLEWIGPWLDRKTAKTMRKTTSLTTYRHLLQTC